MGTRFLMAAAKTAHTSVQWQTLAWIVGAAVVAAVIITIIVLVSRRPKSMEDGIEEFSRSLQAVAPNHRAGSRPGQSQSRSGAGTAQEERSVRATRGETEPV
jgi:Flp pilus assembly protein TadB